MAAEPPREKTIRLTGPVTIYEVTAVRENLRAALADEQHVRIDLADSGPWDVSGLQLLISCVKSGENRDQPVKLVNVPRGCADIAGRSGLTEWLRAAEA